MPSPLRLYTPHPLHANASIALTPEQSHYVATVMRRGNGDPLLLFNGHDGEWQATLSEAHRKHSTALVTNCTRPQITEPDIWLVFAPVKNVRIHFIAEKATELGVSALQPVITAHTIVNKVNLDRLEANVIEAAEQCERLSIPEIRQPLPLDQLLDQWDSSRKLWLADESGGGQSAAVALAQGSKHAKAALLIGPEGGFSRTELAKLHGLPYVTPIGLGPRILRADTATIAALTCWQALLGDWHEPPRFNPTR